MVLPEFDELVLWLRGSFAHGLCRYANPAASFCAGIRESLGQASGVGGKRYGVYIASRQDSSEVLYVGKGGTVDSDGSFKGQDLLGRLTNVRAGDASADAWFADMVRQEGPVEIEFFVVDQEWLPGYLEAALLQAYFTRQRRLPRWNKSF